MTMAGTLTYASDAALWCGPDAVMGSALATEAARSGTHSWSFSRMWVMLGSITVPIIGLDQLTKLYIASHFPLYESRAIIPNWLDLTYTLNPGAAFSLFATMPAAARKVLFLVLSCTAAVVLLVLLAGRSTSATSRVGFALILSGTLGNLIDRLVRGRVVDFIYFHHDSFSYPVFNVADSAITIGVATILLVSFRSRYALDGSSA
ncbi:MAG: signal peptidase II [Deltaproteobacteria bacterium]|nr:signal peptidase II [Deltaproteobacteria bacterium]